MAIAFAATKINGPSYIGTELKMATYTLTCPDTWTSGGVSWDLTDDFDYVTGINCSAAPATGDWDAGEVIKLIGGAYVAGKGFATHATNMKLTAYDGGTVITTADMSALDTLVVQVWGS